MYNISRIITYPMSVMYLLTGLLATKFPDERVRLGMEAGVGISAGRCDNCGKTYAKCKCFPQCESTGCCNQGCQKAPFKRYMGRMGMKQFAVLLVVLLLLRLMFVLQGYKIRY